MLVVIRGPDQRGLARDSERAGFKFPEIVDRFQNIAIGVAVLGRQFEQQSFDVGIDEMRRDLRAHDAGAEHRDLLN